MLAVFFGACVIAVLRLTWRFDALRPVAFALLAGFVEANIADRFWPFEIRLILDPFAEVFVGMTAASAWITLRGRGGRRAWPIIALSIANVCCAMACNVVGTTFEQQWLYVLLTNTFFLIQCVLVGFWGVKHARAGIARWGRRSTDIGPAPGASAHGG